MRISKMSIWERRRVLALIQRELLPSTRARFPHMAVTVRHLKQRLKLGTTYTATTRLGRTVGFVHLLRQRTDVLLDMIAVDRAARRQGAGKALLAHAERVTRTSGRKRLKLYVDTANKEAMQFYLSQGYRYAQHHPHLYCYEFDKWL